MSSKKDIFGWLQTMDLEKSDDSSYQKHFSKGLSKDLILQISKDKGEPKWMLDLRLSGLDAFYKIKMPDYWPDLNSLKFDEICFYAKASDQKNAKKWDDVDPEIKKTFERLKIPEAEREMLAWVWAQYESENIYHNIKEKWENLVMILWEDQEGELLLKLDRGVVQV